MFYKKKVCNNLILTDGLGEFKREVFNENEVFKFALILYQQYVCMINSVEWYETIKKGKAINGSISISYEELVRYVIDPNTKAREKDNYGKDMSGKTRELG